MRSSAPHRPGRCTARGSSLQVVNDELRYAEWIVEDQLAKEPATLAEAFGPSFNPLAAKLLGDVCGFLVTAAALNQDFWTFARSKVVQPPVPQAQTALTEALPAEPEARTQAPSSTVPARAETEQIALPLPAEPAAAAPDAPD